MRLSYDVKASPWTVGWTVGDPGKSLTVPILNQSQSRIALIILSLTILSGIVFSPLVVTSLFFKWCSLQMQRTFLCLLSY
eukprot:scaffold49697_cov62-Attheya_sp.AAC.4